VTGWVDAVYLSKEQPAAMLLEGLAAQNRKLAEDLKTAQARIDELAAAGRASAEVTQQAESGKITDLEQQLDTVRRQLESERVRAGELRSKLATIQDAPPADAKALADLTQENAALKRELEEAQIKAIRAAETAQTSMQTAADARAGALFLAGRWNISATVVMGVLLGALLFGLIAGVWFMDARQRRRLGGFRI
jgi:DNA repair exonuclease SbcCD ATPase subunit